MQIDPTFEGLIPVCDANLFVRQYGRTGPNVVLIHGGPDWDHSYFFPFVLPLARHCRLSAFDLRGCGASTRFGDPDMYSVDIVVDDLVGLMRELRMESAILLGFSFGGRVALRFTDRYPKKVRKLVLTSTTAYDDFMDALEQWDEYEQRHSAALRQRLRSILDGDELTPLEKTVQLAEQSLHLDVYDERLLPSVKKVLDRINFSGEWMRAWRSGKLSASHRMGYGERLNELGLPVLIVHGEKDMRFPMSVARRLHEEVRLSQLSILPRTGHLAHIESPAAWNEAIIPFLAE